MNTEIKAPQFPESVQDGLIVTWHKNVGDSIFRDDLLVDIETDKVVLEVNAPGSGVLSDIIKPADSVVQSLEIIGIISEQAVAKSPVSDPEPTPATEVELVESSSEPLINPAAKKMMDEHDLNADDVEGTAKGGRISKGDVQRVLDNTISESAITEPTPSPANTVKDDAATIAPAPVSASDSQDQTAKNIGVPASSLERNEERVPMTRLRARIAERLVASQHSTAMLTTFNEVNMGALIKLRKAHKESFQERYQAKLGFMSFFLKASVHALQQFPSVNAYIDGNEIIYHDYQDIGVAVSSERGLVVPVLRSVQNLSLAEIETQISNYGKQAQAGKLGIGDLTGGTFTISNGGVFGSLLSTPIINPPQTAILGMHAIQERPVAIDGEVVIQPMMYLALSYDHRLIDGKEAVQFLMVIKNQLEDPTRILLNI